MTTVQKKTACPRDCPDACGLIATIEDGQVVRLQGDPDHPITRGFICQRTSRYPALVNSRQRITQPLYRPSKNAELQPIGWNEALDMAADKLAKFRDESGGASILQYRCGGSMGMMKHVGDHFFEKLGPVTEKSGDVCCGAAEAAQLKDFGDFDSNEFFDIHNAKTIFLWGKNVFVSSIHVIPDLKKAKANGTRIVAIDPVYNQTAQIADTFIQPRPGSDAAIAFGIARWLIENNKHDPNAADYCDHVDEFCDIAFSKSLNDWAQIADLSVQQLEELATLFSQGPTASLIGWGLQRRRFGATSIRAIDGLVAISGNLGIKGGGASFYFVRRDAFDFSFSKSPAARKIPEPLLGEKIIAANDPPIRMAWIWAANPVDMLPDSARVAEALRTREFTVVVDPFLTDSARCADLVLPTTTFLEEDDYIGAYGHHYLAEVRPVVSAPAGVLSDHDIFLQLAERLQLDGFSGDTSTWKSRLLNKLKTQGIDEASFKKGYVKNPFTKEVFAADRKFKTESGKVNLLKSLPDGMFQQQSSSPRVTAVSTRKAQGAQWFQEEQEGPAAVVLHPSAAKGFQDGDVVTLKTQHSSIEVRLKFDAQQRPDVLLMEKGGWQHNGRSANSLIRGELTDDGECAVYYDTPAQFTKTL